MKDRSGNAGSLNAAGRRPQIGWVSLAMRAQMQGFHLEITNRRFRETAEWLSLAEIEIGDRRRGRPARVDALAKSIHTKGLIHPPVVDADGLLVAGGSRIAAMESLGAKRIPVLRFEDLTDDEMRGLELDENVVRTDLTPFQKAREMVEKTAEIIEDEQKPRKKSAVKDGKPDTNKEAPTSAKGGRSKKGGTKAAAREMGVDEKSVRLAREHITIAEEFPEMEGPDWSQTDVLKAGKFLDKIGAKHRATFGAMIFRPGCDQREAIIILGNVASESRSEIDKIAGLYESHDEGQRTLAVTKAKKVAPPMSAEFKDWVNLYSDARGAVRRISPKHEKNAKEALRCIEMVMLEMKKEYQETKKES